MDYDWFDQECYLAPDDAGTSAYFIPVHRVAEVMASDANGLDQESKDPVVGKCPVDGRIRPVYITYKNKRVLAIADGKGDAYKTYTDPKDGYAYGDNPRPGNKYDPDEYEFERGLSGMDY